MDLLQQSALFLVVRSTPLPRATHESPCLAARCAESLSRRPSKVRGPVGLYLLQQSTLVFVVRGRHWNCAEQDQVLLEGLSAGRDGVPCRTSSSAHCSLLIVFEKELWSSDSCLSTICKDLKRSRCRQSYKAPTPLLSHWMSISAFALPKPLRVFNSGASHHQNRRGFLSRYF